MKKNELRGAQIKGEEMILAGEGRNGKISCLHFG